MSETLTTGGSGRTGGKSKFIKIGRHGGDKMIQNPEENEKMMSKFVFKDKNAPITTEEKIKRVKKLIASLYGIDLDKAPVPDKIGFEISNDSQRKILFGVLNEMTKTDYKGTETRPVDMIQDPLVKDRKRYISTGSYNPQVASPYKNINFVPVLRKERRELMRICGFDPTSKSDRRDFGEALSAITTDNYFLMWKRFKRDEEGNLVKTGQKTFRNNKGRFQSTKGRTDFELVSAIDTILKIRFIHNPNTQKMTHYEIMLNPVFFDEMSPEFGGERGNFILVPEDSLDEIKRTYKKIYPSSRGYIPPAILNLCWWFRLEVLNIQNRNRNKFTKNPRGGKISKKYIDLCQILNIPRESALKNKNRIQKTLETGIELAKEIGYIKEGTRNVLDNDEYLFELNFDYYPNEYRDENKELQEPERGTGRVYDM